MEAPGPRLVEFVIADTCRISGRGTVALPEGDPRPWWPFGWHRVRVTPPGGHVFEADAGMQLIRRQGGAETMVLLFRDMAPQDLPLGCRVVSLATTPYEVKAIPAPQYDVKAATVARRWWQFWK